MDVDQIRQDVAQGTIDLDRLVDLLASQQRLIEKQQAEIEKQQAEIEKQQAEIEKQQAEIESLSNGKNPTERIDEPFSERSEEQRQAKTKKKPKNKKPKRRGRICTAEKIAQAARTETVYPEDCHPDECRWSHTRVAWRLENGKAVLVAYEVYRYGSNCYGKVPGVSGRSEFGMEIVVALAFQVYVIGLSIDKACQVMGFFQELKLSKSQADALLNQLAKQWEAEFNTLCMLLSNAVVIATDETSWSINRVWTFLTDTITLMFYGVHKDGATLEQILDKATFDGVLISDDAAVYQNFTHAQKCWAHLIRKAVKLTLQAPDEARYRDFADGLLEIYRIAKRLSVDQRYSPAGRARRVDELDDLLLELCLERWADENEEQEGVEADFRRLVNEVMKLMLARELFTFVTTEGVSGNNNQSERELRDDALRRKTGRTNKTANGAKRQTILTSVLRTLGKQLEEFTLEKVIAEVGRWMKYGRSRFTDQAEAANLKRPPPPTGERSLLDRLILDAGAPSPT